MKLYPMQTKAYTKSIKATKATILKGYGVSLHTNPKNFNGFEAAVFNRDSFKNYADVAGAPASLMDNSRIDFFKIKEAFKAIDDTLSNVVPGSILATTITAAWTANTDSHYLIFFQNFDDVGKVVSSTLSYGTYFNYLYRYVVNLLDLHENEVALGALADSIPTLTLLKARIDDLDWQFKRSVETDLELLNFNLLGDYWREERLAKLDEQSD